MSRWLVVALLLVAFGGFAQDEWEGRGEIEEAEVVIEKDRKIVLPVASRVYERLPDFDIPIGNLGLSYTYLPVSYRPGLLNLRVRPLTIRPQPLDPVRIGNVKLGYGNYQTPLLEASIGSGRSDEYLYNIFLRHRSSGTGPVDGKNSGDSDSRIGASGSFYLNEATFSGGVTYQLEQFTFYGYDPSLDVTKSDIEQALNKIYLFGRIEKNDPDQDADYMANVSFDFVGDKFEANEADFGLNLFGSYAVDDALKMDVIADFYMINRKDVNIKSYNRHLLRVKPYARYTLDRLDAQVGLSTVLENDTLGDSKSFRLFPYLHFDYTISDQLSAFAGFKADVDKKTLKGFLSENRYLGQNINVFHQNRTFDLYLGIEGQLGSNWNYKLTGDYLQFKNRAFFVNDPTDTSKFQVIYETGTTGQNTFTANLGYDVTRSINFALKGSFYVYSLDQLSEAWHLPEYALEATSVFKLAEKFKINVDAQLLGGIKAPNPADGMAIELDGIVNLDAGISYLISNRASVFINGYNLLGKSYQRYLNYDSRQLQLIGGLSYSF